MVSGIEKLMNRQRKYYKSIGSVHSPVLKEKVYFNADGFYHLIYQSNRRLRNVSERHLKLKCLDYAVHVIKKCETTPKKREYARVVRGKKKKAISYELVCEVKSEKFNKIKVIVERIGGGKIRFLSVMPIKRDRWTEKTKKHP